MIAGITVVFAAIPRWRWYWQWRCAAVWPFLYTSAVAGIVIALTGGSSFSVSGPTAAFVVILHPVSQQFGLAGLTGRHADVGLPDPLFGPARLGRLIEYIPVNGHVVLPGIGIPSVPCRLKIFLVCRWPMCQSIFLQKSRRVSFMALPTVNIGDAAIGVVTLGTLIFWPRLGIRLPDTSSRAAGWLRRDGDR
ncbi:hypothetical protein KCP73_00195 [Salmonella enterica subsp. enterica]|nr:hypothetical protein KCP73_00195 [Salmonella enterica subsp. enterica]